MVKVKELKGLRRVFTLSDNKTLLVLKAWEEKEIEDNLITDTLLNAQGLKEVSIKNVASKPNKTNDKNEKIDINDKKAGEN